MLKMKELSKLLTLLIVFFVSMSAMIPVNAQESFKQEKNQETLSQEVDSTEKSKTEAPKVNQTEKGKVEEPKVNPTEKSKTEEPKVNPTEKSKTEEPKVNPTEKSKTEEPKVNPTEKSKTEEPKVNPTEKGKVEEPKVNPTFEEPRKRVKRSARASEFRPGDIFIVRNPGNKTGFNWMGATGHAAIMGWGEHVYDLVDGGPRAPKFDKWLSENGDVDIYRPSISGSTMTKVLNWANDYIWKHNEGIQRVEYGITPSWSTYTPSYCSKFVFQAFWFGSGSENVMKKPGGYSYTNVTLPTIINPYQLPLYFNSKPAKIRTGMN
jgi:hypothetical protein